MTAPYHFHHPEKMILDRAELRAIILGQRLMTVALAMESQPYLVTMNYGFDPECDCFYFHGAESGRKLAYLKANPSVWGQVIEDRGYVYGKCDHAYRSVHFSGRVGLLEDETEKRAALTLMIRQLEPDPGPVEERLLGRARLTSTVVGRIQVFEMTGKSNALELVGPPG
jgi:hypothetical protein